MIKLVHFYNAPIICRCTFVKKNNLLNGFDDIDYLQAMKSEISAFAENR